MSNASRFNFSVLLDRWLELYLRMNGRVTLGPYNRRSHHWVNLLWRYLMVFRYKAIGGCRIDSSLTIRTDLKLITRHLNDAMELPWHR
ncbi:hypothetical protein TRIP_B120052 [uncultured Desulfatiglans sp.]|uniref:Uncharacterized protein n=1 Tax=Uncultured Desulfatiglans sp. TaxID=1748965 RepID=A0A653A0P6_UNCDX|nr:hypothetical protein TRIP_B120052 [uncultured Desulfatiglans sp.]